MTKDKKDKPKTVPDMTSSDVAPVVSVKFGERCTFMATEEELKRLKIDSINAGQTLSNYIRAIIFGKR